MVVYDVGDQPTVTGTIRDTDGVLADPTTVGVFYLDPSGNQATGDNATSSSTGIWVWTFPATLDESGTWRVRFVAGGDLVAAEEIIVRVRSTNFST